MDKKRGFKLNSGRKAKRLPEGFDFKNKYLLSSFITERHKIIPRRISGLSAADQRKLTLAIKRARHIGLIPYSSTQLVKRQKPY